MKQSSRAVRTWVRIYTSGLPADVAADRLAEIESDVYEQITCEHDHPRRARASVVSRMTRGVPDDLSWRREERRIMKQQSPEGPTFGLRSARATLAHEWFAPAVAVLAVMYVVITVQAWMAASELPDRLATTLFFVGCTGALVVGLHLRRVTATSDTTGPAPPLRSGRRLLGDGLLIVGTAPSFAFYWAIVPLMLGIVVIAGVLSQRAPEHSDALVHGEPR